MTVEKIQLTQMNELNVILTRYFPKLFWVLFVFDVLFRFPPAGEA